MPEEQDKQGSKYNPQSVEEALKIIESLEKRVGERDADNQKLRGDLSEYGKRLKAIEEGQQQRLQEQGDFKALAEKYQAELAVLRPIAERAEKLEANIRETNESTIARIPEARRGAIPYEYAPEKLQKYLADNAAFFMREPAPDFNAGDGSGDGRPPAKLTDAEKEAASLMGVKLETMEKLKAQDAQK